MAAYMLIDMFNVFNSLPISFLFAAACRHIRSRNAAAVRRRGAHTHTRGAWRGARRVRPDGICALPGLFCSWWFLVRIGSRTILCMNIVFSAWKGPASSLISPDTCIHTPHLVVISSLAVGVQSGFSLRGCLSALSSLCPYWPSQSTSVSSLFSFGAFALAARAAYRHSYRR